MVRTIDGAGTLEYTIKVSAENNFTPDRRFSIQFQTCSYFKTDFGQANRTISRGHEGHLAGAWQLLIGKTSASKTLFS